MYRIYIAFNRYLYIFTFLPGNRRRTVHPTELFCCAAFQLFLSAASPGHESDDRDCKGLWPDYWRASALSAAEQSFLPASAVQFGDALHRRTHPAAFSKLCSRAGRSTTTRHVTTKYFRLSCKIIPPNLSSWP